MITRDELSRLRGNAHIALASLMDDSDDLERILRRCSGDLRSELDCILTGMDRHIGAALEAMDGLYDAAHAVIRTRQPMDELRTMLDGIAQGVDAWLVKE